LRGDCREQPTRPHASVPGLDADTAARVVDAVVPRHACLLDLLLSLEHVHWNVVGPMFMSVVIADHRGAGASRGGRRN
jgi:starvation-inducible DNA-binding protein